MTISTPDADPVQGSSFTSDISVDVGEMVLGSYSVAFLFNENVLEITSVQGGNLFGIFGNPHTQ